MALASIADATKECRETFKKCLDQPYEYPRTENDVARLYSNFERWASSLSVDQMGLLSLDAMLNTDTTTRKKLVDLLLPVARHLRKGADSFSIRDD